MDSSAYQYIRDGNDVAEFLDGLSRPVIVETVRNKTGSQTSPAIHRPTAPRTRGETTRSGKLILRGKAYPYNNAKDAMVIVLRKLAKGGSMFLECCSQHPDAQSCKRRDIARTPKEFYSDRPDLREFREFREFRETYRVAGSSQLISTTC